MLIVIVSVHTMRRNEEYTSINNRNNAIQLQKLYKKKVKYRVTLGSRRIKRFVAEERHGDILSSQFE